MKMSLWNHLCVCFIPESSQRQHSAQTCCKLHASFVRPSHPLQFNPSLHVSVPQWAVHVLADDQRCLVGDQHYEHQQWIIKDNNIKTRQSLLFIVFPLFFIRLCLFHFSFVPLLIWMAWLFWAKKRAWYVQTCVTVWEERSRNTAVAWSQPQIVALLSD